MIFKIIQMMYDLKDPEIPSPNRMGSPWLCGGRKVLCRAQVILYTICLLALIEPVKIVQHQCAHQRGKNGKVPMDSHGILAASVRFCKFFLIFWHIQVPYPKSVDTWPTCTCVGTRDHFFISPILVTIIWTWKMTPPLNSSCILPLLGGTCRLIVGL